MISIHPYSDSKVDEDHHAPLCEGTIIKNDDNVLTAQCDNDRTEYKKNTLSIDSFAVGKKIQVLPNEKIVTHEIRMTTGDETDKIMITRQGKLFKVYPKFD